MGNKQETMMKAQALAILVWYGVTSIAASGLFVLPPVVVQTILFLIIVVLSMIDSTSEDLHASLFLLLAFPATNGRFGFGC